MQLASTLALLAATSNALALLGKYQHNNCGFDDGWEACRELVYLGDYTTEAEYTDCLETVLDSESLSCGEDNWDCIMDLWIRY